MNERITLISIFDEENQAKITKYTSKIHNKICKVPYGKGVVDREKADTLPYHFTLYTFDIKKEKEVREYFKTQKFLRGLRVEVDKIKIISGKEDSYVLVFAIKENEMLKRYRRIFIIIIQMIIIIQITFNFILRLILVKINK